MRLSQYFIPTLKEKPSDAEISSHVLMLRSGMVRQSASGIYSWLPLGLKVLDNIANIIRKGLDQGGCIQMLMPCIQPLKLWQESERLEVYGKEMLKFPDRHDNMLLFGPTCEELITDIIRKDIKSYKQLPKNFYHIQWKFRDEIRPRFGVMRGREFLMKDGYSFDVDKDSAINTYKNMFVTYLKIFKALGVKTIPVLADSGAIGGNLCHEFQILASTGESTIYYDEKLENIDEKNYDFDYLTSLYAADSEKHDSENCPVDLNQIKSHKAIEVGHIFYFGTKYTQMMNALVQGPDGSMIAPYCGSYGIGVSRLVGAIIEANFDEHGIKWPKEVAPFFINLMNLDGNNELVNNICNEIYCKLQDSGVSVLYDDSGDSAGMKFANADLIGCPWQVIVGKKFINENIIEIKDRGTLQKYSITSDLLVENMIKLFNAK